MAHAWGAAVRERTADLLEDADAEELAGAPDDLRMLALRGLRAATGMTLYSQPQPVLLPQLEHV